MSDFENRLTGGHPNSLGNTVSVVEDVLENPRLLEALFQCYESKDEVVRLRVSNAMKRIAKANNPLLIPYLDRLIADISKINQASTQWTLSQLFLIYEKHLSSHQYEAAVEIMKKNLLQSNDWIVINMTLETLGKWGKKDAALKEWLLPPLEKYRMDSRKSIQKKALKTIEKLR